MLKYKMLRELRQNFGQYFSLFILVALAVATFAGIMANPIGGRRARALFHEQTRLASAWLYGEGFTQEDLEHVRALEYVESAQLRTSVTGTAPDCGGAQIDLYLESENLVSMPLTVEGADFDPTDPDGIWLCRTFAEAWNIQAGSTFTISYDGIEITKEVKGLVVSPEYEYMCADKDADTDFANIGYAFMDYEAFPVREYLTYMIGNEKITAEDIEQFDENDASAGFFDSAAGKIVRAAMKSGLVTTPMLLDLLDALSDEQLQTMLPYTQMLVRGKGGTDLLAKETEIAEAIDYHYAAMVDEHSIIGIERLTSELEQHEAFSYTFLAIFVAIAVLVIMTGTSRMVAQQRTQIGTMNALGMTHGKITRHYLSYSLIVAAAGCIVGLLVGYLALGSWVVSLFSYWYVVPGWTAGMNRTYAAVIALVLVTCVGSAYLSCRRLLNVAPAEALRPAAPCTGKRTLFEHLPFWNRLGFRARYNLRDVSRYKLRAVMGIAGTAAGMMILTGCFASRSLVGDILSWDFERILNCGYEAVLDADVKLSAADELAQSVSGELVMTTAIEVAAKERATNRDKSTQTLTVIEGKGLYNVTDEETQVTGIPEGTVGITRRLAGKMGLGVGDTIWWHIYEENDWHSATIGVITRAPETSGISMLRADLEAEDVDFEPTMLVSGEPIPDDNELVQTVYTIDELRSVYDASMGLIVAVILFMIVMALILVVVVLYNCGSLSFNERIRELATLKVMGLSDRKIRSLLTWQNFWLSIAGIILGAPFGGVMLQAMMNSNGENFDYYARVLPLDYILAAAFVLLTSMAVSFLFSGRIRRLDLVGTLKEAE